MTYTRDFDVTTPADGDLLSAGDDSIRDFKVDVEERLASAYVDINADPMVPKDESIPATALKSGSISFAQLDPSLNIRSIIIAGISVSDTIASGAIGGGGGPFTIDGAEEGDVVVCSWPDGRFSVMAAVTAPDQVTIAFANITAGPLTVTDAALAVAVIKAGVPGTLHGDLNPKIPATEFQPADMSVPAVYTVNYVSLGANGPQTFFGSRTLQAGSIITTAKLSVGSANTATVTGKLWKVAGGVATQLDVDFVVTTGAGNQLVSISPAYTALQGDEFVFEVTLDSTTSTGADDAVLFYAELVLG